MSDELSSRVELQLENMLGESVTPEKPRSRIEVLLSELNGTIEALQKATTWIGVTTTELTNGSTVDTITINGSSVFAQEGDIASYNGAKYVYNGSIWQTYSDTDDYLVNGDITQTTGQNTDKVMSQKAVTDKFNTKANTDGSYETLTSGNSYQLVSSTMTENKIPYNFRTTGGSADVGDREYPVVHGGTLTWNQLIPTAKKSAAYIASESTDTYSKVLESVSISAVPGHKMFMGVKFARTISGNNRITFVIGPTSNYVCHFIFENGDPDGYVFSIGEVPSDVTTIERIGINNYYGKRGFDEGDTVSIDDLMLIDLTSLFGSAIADYIYSLEQANNGAGVAWFRKLFPKPYYAYSARKLESVQTSSHSTIGFNQWDEEWERGSINDNGQNSNSEYSIRSVGYTACFPDTEYCFTRPVGVPTYLYWYDGAKTFLKRVSINATNTFWLVTSPSNACFVRIRAGNSLTPVTTYDNDMCLNLHWDGERDGEYEAYVKRIYPLDDSLTLRGIPKLDSNNELYYDGDIYEPDGTVTRRFAERAYAAGDESLADAITDGTTTVYLINASTTESADPYQATQICSNWGTEELVDAAVEAGDRDVAIPVGHLTKYPPDLKAKLEMVPDSPDGAGDYIMRQTSGLNTYVPLVFPSELPDLPTTDGNYTLKAIVTDGTATLSWVAEE